MLRHRLSRREALRVMGGSALAATLSACRAARTPGKPEAQMQSLQVRNEFGQLRAALVHDGDNARDWTMEQIRELIPADELREHPECGPALRSGIIAQQAEFCRVLTEHGVSLLRPEWQKDANCQVFTRDPCFVVGDTLFVGGLRDGYRHAETDGLVKIRERVPSVVDLSGDGALIEGGDVMVLDEGRRVLVGMHRHTNEAGIGKLTAHLARSAVDVIRVPHRSLHLDCCLAPLPNGQALYCASKLPDSSVDVLGACFTGLIALDRDEAELHLAANLFWITDRKVVASRNTPQTNKLLREAHYDVIELDFSHLVHCWGSFRCVVCPLDRG